jgi:hypothetical protein
MQKHNAKQNPLSLGMGNINRHLNWMWLGAFALYMVAIIAGSLLNVWIGLVGWVVYMGACVWILSEKNRSIGWILISIAIPFLSNKSK